MKNLDLGPRTDIYHLRPDELSTQPVTLKGVLLGIAASLGLGLALYGFLVLGLL